MLDWTCLWETEVGVEGEQDREELGSGRDPETTTHDQRFPFPLPTNRNPEFKMGMSELKGCIETSSHCIFTGLEKTPEVSSLHPFPSPSPTPASFYLLLTHRAQFQNAEQNKTLDSPWSVEGFTGFVEGSSSLLDTAPNLVHLSRLGSWKQSQWMSSPHPPLNSCFYFLHYTLEWVWRGHLANTLILWRSKMRPKTCLRSYCWCFHKEKTNRKRCEGEKMKGADERMGDIVWTHSTALQVAT